MNLFVLNKGRCGSMTFVDACRHITKYTVAHESRTGRLAAERLDYPPNRIDADNRLSWFLGRLEGAYGDCAIYVHLRRSERDTALSFVRRYDTGIILAYRTGILYRSPSDLDPLKVAVDYCHTVNLNIEASRETASSLVSRAAREAGRIVRKMPDFIRRA